MQNPRDVLLCSTLHDPRGVFFGSVQKVSSVVANNYTGWVINVTPTTDQRTKDAVLALASSGVYLTETDPAHPIVPDAIENDHLYLLEKTVGIAKKLGIRKVQYTDGDRIITAATHFPEDLGQMAKEASEMVGDTKSYVNFRRSIEDYFSHHPPLVETEFEFNRLYSEVFGMPLDIGSTAHGMSLDVIEEILHRSPQMESVSFPHPKWILIAKEMGVPICAKVIKKVLTFETPDQFKPEVQERIDEARLRYDLPIVHDASYSVVQKDYMATLGLDSTTSSREWDLRFRTEQQYLTLLKNHLTIFGYDEEREGLLRREINRSLVTMEGRHKAITEALRQQPDEVGRVIRERAERVLTQKSSQPEGK